MVTIQANNSSKIFCTLSISSSFSDNKSKGKEKVEKKIKGLKTNQDSSWRQMHTESRSQDNIHFPKKRRRTGKIGKQKRREGKKIEAMLSTWLGKQVPQTVPTNALSSCCLTYPYHPLLKKIFANCKQAISLFQFNIIGLAGG